MRLRPLESRILALFLALLVLAGGYFVLVHWWFVAPQLDMNGRIRQLRAEQHRFASIIAERPALEARLARLRRGQAASNALLTGGDPGTASANLMQYVVDVVHAHTAQGPCAVTQKMPVQDRAGNGSGPYREVTVNISLSCSMHALAVVLYNLEHGRPYLFIDNFSAYRNPVRRPDGSLQPLRVQFNLSGYLRQPAAGSNS